MRRLSVVPRSARLLAGVLVAGALLAACRPKDKGPDSTDVPPDTTRPPASASLPGALTKPLEQYSGDEFYELTRRLTWGGGVEDDRKCKGEKACDDAATPKYTKVRIDAVDGQDSLPAIGGPANGVVSVRALNKGDVAEARYGFKPGKQLEYYLVVLPGDAKTGKWVFEELDTTPGARKISSAGSGTFTPCNHPYRPKRVNRANFYTCAESQSSDSVQKSGLLMFDRKTNPVWIGCALGCCIAD